MITKVNLIKHIDIIIKPYVYHSWRVHFLDYSVFQGPILDVRIKADQ